MVVVVDREVLVEAHACGCLVGEACVVRVELLLRLLVLLLAGARGRRAGGCGRRHLLPLLACLHLPSSAAGRAGGTRLASSPDWLSALLCSALLALSLPRCSPACRSSLQEAFLWLAKLGLSLARSVLYGRKLAVASAALALLLGRPIMSKSPLLRLWLEGLALRFLLLLLLALLLLCLPLACCCGHNSTEAAQKLAEGWRAFEFEKGE